MTLLTSYGIRASSPPTEPAQLHRPCSELLGGKEAPSFLFKESEGEPGKHPELIG